MGQKQRIESEETGKRSRGTAGESGQSREIMETTQRGTGCKDSRSESSRGKMRARECVCVCASV